ncbi:MAG: oligopeptide transport system permease protein AppC [Deltaproteobacteria bacterium]|nr:oligopeptide transport system permease protein AppC [Deltaproteobacteria bacterium]
MTARRRAGAVIWASGGLLAVFYLAALAAPFVAPYDFTAQNRSFPHCPPSRVYVRPAAWGSESLFYTHPYVLADPVLRRYEEQSAVRVPIRLFSDGHLFTTPPGAGQFFLLGTDGLGRDLFSRIVHGGRVSLFIGIVGVAISFSIGTVVGSIAGYSGGWVDNVIMRLVEVEMSLPSFYFLLALAAVIPVNLSSATTFFLIVVLLSFINWAGFARVIRGMVSSLRESAYVTAARALGASRWRILTRHVIPGTFSYTTIAATISIPSFILGESALSLLGLGIQEPSASWGNLLADAQNVQNLVKYPWILTPGVFIFLTVMAFNFLGDYLRDRLDPRAVQG